MKTTARRQKASRTNGAVLPLVLTVLPLGIAVLPQMVAVLLLASGTKKDTSTPTSAEQNMRFWSGAVLPLRSHDSTDLEQ